MPTNKQRREAARRHLERQLQRRQEQEATQKRRMLIATVAGSLVLVVVVVVVVIAVTNDNGTKPAAAGSSSASASASSSPLGIRLQQDDRTVRVYERRSGPEPELEEHRLSAGPEADANQDGRRRLRHQPRHDPGDARRQGGAVQGAEHRLPDRQEVLRQHPLSTAWSQRHLRPAVRRPQPAPAPAARRTRSRTRTWRRPSTPLARSPWPTAAPNTERQPVLLRLQGQQQPAAEELHRDRPGHQRHGHPAEGRRRRRRRLQRRPAVASPSCRSRFGTVKITSVAGGRPDARHRPVAHRRDAESDRDAGTSRHQPPPDAQCLIDELGLVDDGYAGAGR